MKIMKIAYFKHLASLGCIVAVAGLLSGGCNKAEIENYTSKDKLWFTQVDNNKDSVGTLTRSFSHFPGAKTLRVPFEVTLIGAIADHDREYKVVVVDSLTTAVAGEYEVDPTIFRAGRPVDTMWVTLHKTPRMDNMKVKLTLHFIENDAFTTGYTGRLSATINFNNITSRPDWWTEAITLSYFGPYSKEKFEAFYTCTGVNTIEGLEPSELRKLLLYFKKYIADNNITEADGSEMVIPIH